ncbi:MAG TPA: MBL fold metallo-hydrolase [Bordetella sp.]|nr:MBL fold metallo-hydrolase [Bordetella sp.]
MPVQVEGFFDPGTATVSYVVYERVGGVCAIIDPVLDYDSRAARTSTASADRIAEFVRRHDLQVQWLLETHVHADHLSGSPYLQRQLGGMIAIGQGVSAVQNVFKPVYNLEPEFQLDGSQFGHLFAADEAFSIGGLAARALHVPGHTPADMAYLIEDAVFVGDTLFMPDVGTARCDFPGGDAHAMYASVRMLLSLPEQTRMFVCHDYPPAGRQVAWETTVAEQRRANVHLRDGVSEADFVAMRTHRDATLSLPALMLPAIQVNLRAGHPPPADANGTRYLRIPLDLF